MLFNSFEFVLFFPIVTLLFFLLPHRFRALMLLGASCYFYMAFVPEYILILAITIVVDYAAGILIAESEGRRRKMFLNASVIVTCLILFIFKYFNFINTNFELLAKQIGWNYPIGALELILPIGLSFHTFQSLSYVIEVYRGHQKPEKNFITYSLYVMFYPQLVAGPIERPQNLLTQLQTEQRFVPYNFVFGMRKILWGLFKKMVIADNLAIMANTVFDSPNDHGTVATIVASIFFTFQIYCDFSGYSDIAIGTARVMGFELMTNFRRPFYARSITKFWRRWHISLSTWFKDYLYFPLGGSKVGTSRRYFNLFITFFVSGLWHGASWNFVIWGAIHGFLQIAGIATTNFRLLVSKAIGLYRIRNLRIILNVLGTFMLVMLAFVFFRAKDLDTSVIMIGKIFSNPFNELSIVFGTRTGFVENIQLGQPTAVFLAALLGIVFMEVVHLLERKREVSEILNGKPPVVRYGVYIILVMAILNFGVPNDVPFIYFQF